MQYLVSGILAQFFSVVETYVVTIRNQNVYHWLLKKEIPLRQYLSNQFKQITGFRPSQFRTMLEARRSQIDKV